MTEWPAMPSSPSGSEVQEAAAAACAVLQSTAAQLPEGRHPVACPAQVPSHAPSLWLQSCLLIPNKARLSCLGNPALHASSSAITSGELPAVLAPTARRRCLHLTRPQCRRHKPQCVHSATVSRLPCVPRWAGAAAAGACAVPAAQGGARCSAAGGVGGWPSGAGHEGWRRGAHRRDQPG